MEPLKKLEIGYFCTIGLPVNCKFITVTCLLTHGNGMRLISALQALADKGNVRPKSEKN